MPLTYRISDAYPLLPAQRRRAALDGLGAVLYPDLFHRRACEAIRVAGARVANKQEAPPVAAGEASPPRTPVAPGGPNGRSNECA